MTAATVIVATATGGERLRRLLASLGPELPEQTIVVDNASGDPGLGDLERDHAGVEILRMATNVGFGRAVNAAAERARCPVLVLVNDDCVCEPGFVEALASAIDPAAGVAMAAGVLRESADPTLIDSAGIEVDRTLLGFDYLNGEPVSVLEDGVADPIGPTGGAAAFDRSVYLAAGGFDEALFAFWEDVDLALRMRLEGHRCVLVADARATHEHSGTLGSGSAAKNHLMGYGRGYLVRKYGVLTPGRALGVAARDGIILAGQVMIDRNAAGVRGRVSGWLGGRKAYEYPRELIETFQPPGFRSTLRRRSARRARLRGADRPAPDPPRRDAVEADPRPARALAIFHVGEISGPARSLEDRLSWLAEAADLHVIVPGDGATAAIYEPFADVGTLRYEALTLPRTPVELLIAGNRLRREVAAFRARIRELRPDLVVVSSATLPAAQIAARREGAPVVLEASELLTSGRGLPRRLAGRALVRIAGAYADVVFACSSAVAAEYAGADSPVVTSYAPIEDAADGDGGAFRDRHGIPSDAPLVLAVGSITERRGQDVLIEAMGMVHPRRPVCVIEGQPFPRPKDLAFDRRLRELADRAGEMVLLIGNEPRLADAYAAADVVVNPRRDPEAFGRVQCEALVAGCPVVAARTGAVAEVLRDGATALLVPPGDPAALAAAVSTLLDDPDLGRRLAEHGRDDVLRRFSPAEARARFRSGLELVWAARPRPPQS